MEHAKPEDDDVFGETGKFPEGRLDPSDEGELRFGIAADRDNGVVMLEFGKAVKWLGMPLKWPGLWPGY